MEKAGIISPYNGNTPRKVLVSEYEGIETEEPKEEAPADEQKPPARKRKAKPKVKTAPKSRKGVGGRTTAWEALEMDTKLEAVRGWAMQGATMEELADMLGVNVCTLYEWQKKTSRQYHAEFAKAVRAGRYIASGEVVASAYKQSTGHMMPEVKGVKVKRWELVCHPLTGEPFMDRLGNPIMKLQEYVETVENFVFIPPNPHITQFMLKNWLPDQFKDRQEIDVSDTAAPQFEDDLMQQHRQDGE
jgi:transposase-like protein